MAAAFAMQPVLHPAGPGNSSPVDAFTLLSIIAAALWTSTAGVRIRAPYVFGVGLMVIGGAVAGAAGALPRTALLSLVQDVVLLAWCAAVATLSADPRRLLVLARTWAYCASACALILISGSLLGISAISGVVPREGNRALFTFGDPNYAATFWVLSIFVVHSCLTPRHRIVRLAAYAALLWSLLLTESNGGIVELALGCAVLAVAAALRRGGPAAAVALVLALAGTAGAVAEFVPVTTVQTWARNSGQPLLVNSIGRSDDSSAQRGQLIGEALDLYRADGWQGSGPASTKSLLEDRSYPYAKEAHDDYLAALVERGPLGLLGILTLAASVAWRARRALRGAFRRPWAEPLPRPVGLLAALVAVAAAATYYEVLHFRFIWALFGLVAGYAYARSPLDRRHHDGRPT
jgi:hypothetical protein